MKQILQNLNTGETWLEDVPAPKVRRNHLLIQTSRSLVSAGTERMLVEFGRANLLDKARQQPEKVRLVLDKVKTDGLLPTIEAVRNKLDQPLAMGYCNVGTVVEVGEGVTGFAVGDRVASNGKHAEVICVPKTLCAKVPDNVGDESAAFTVIGAIGLQGIRLIQPTLGESVVVTGLGLIGILAVQLLRAHGCRVLGIDVDPAKLRLARQFGAETVDVAQGEDPVAAAMSFSRGRGVDAVLIAAATKSNEPVHQAALMSRKRGRIVLVGVVGLELARADFYEKELSFQVSCSYGPGRHDDRYEERGEDYPFGFVRWTEQRNFEAVLDMLADGRLHVEPLISHRFSLERARDVYDLVGGRGPSLGIVLRYASALQNGTDKRLQRTIVRQEAPVIAESGAAVAGFIGSGNYATQVLIPAFKSAGALLDSVASSTGVTAAHAGRKFGFKKVTTDADSVLQSGGNNIVVIATRHDSHASLACRGLRAGKHVFLEKPLAVSREDLEEIVRVWPPQSGEERTSLPILMVGFNRRFASQIVRMHTLLRGVKDPKTFIMTVNAGAVPLNHWTQDRQTGGGRIVGEGCHFIDLLRFLAGAPIVAVRGSRIGGELAGSVCDDKATFTLQFADGSIGTVHYLANGHKSFPKERLEVFVAGRVLQLDNFRKLQGFGWPGFTRMNLWRQDKGNAACVAAFVEAVRSGGPSPIPFEELIEVARATFDVVDALR